MKRWSLFLLAFALLICTSFAGYLYLYRTDFASLALTRAFGTTVKLKTLDFTQQGLKIKGFEIENPAGSKVKKAFSAHQIKIKVNYLNLLKALTGVNCENIFIENIVIDKPMMYLELYDKAGIDNNWKRILERSELQKESPSSRGFLVKKVLITKMQLEAKLHNSAGSGLRPTPLEQVEIKDLRTEGPLSAREVFQSIMKRLLERTGRT